MNMLKLFSKSYKLPTAIIFLLSSITFFSCGKKLPMDQSIGTKSYQLVNQDSSKVVFPDDFKGKIVVMGFIYTNCPDICPLTTHNMEETQNLVKKDKLKNVQFLALTFDPDRDTPSVLKEYGKIRNIDFKNFQFLTGNKVLIDTLIHHMDVFAIPGDTTYTKKGNAVYFFTHTDRITLLGPHMHIRDEFRGSSVAPKNIIKEIKKLQ